MVIYKNQPATIQFTADNSGLAWDAFVAQDGSGYGVATGVVTDVSGTTYQFVASAADTNANTVQFLLVANNGSMYDSGVITTSSSTPGQIARNRADLRAMMRTMVDEINSNNTGAIVDSTVSTANPSLVDLNSALFFGYEKVSADLKSFPTQITLASTPGQAIYPYSSLGTVGSRLFEIDNIWYNQQILTQMSKDEMDANNYMWLFDSDGTPIYWVQWGAQNIRLYYAPSGTSNIDITGWLLPDPTTFADDSAVPALNMLDIELVPLAAAIRFTESKVNQDNNLRFQYYQTKYALGVKEANGRLKGSKPTIFGRGPGGGRLLNINRTVYSA
jgi:hypothetical protein